MRKVVKGSFLNLFGNILFRIGGYLYRVLLQYLLGVTGYGIVSLVLPLQNVLILVAAAGIPPAVAKYVAEYHAKNDGYMVKQIIKTSAKIMVTMSIIATLLIFFLAKPLAPFLHWQPNIVILFQIIGFITPFSIILGLVRGIFQGYQDMGNLLLTRAVEQIFTIILSVSLILLGFYVLGAVIGTIIGFAIAAVLSLLLFIQKIWKIISICVNLYSI
jgi:stage V sporulation protein B